MMKEEINNEFQGVWQGLVAGAIGIGIVLLLSGAVMRGCAKAAENKTKDAIEAKIQDAKNRQR